MSDADATRILQRLGAGEAAAADELLPLLHGELRRLAEAAMRNERGDHTLQPTALLNEAFMRLAGPNEWDSRKHFLRVAARAMRNILVDHARARGAAKRGGPDSGRVSLDTGVHGSELVGEDAERVIVVHDLLDRLAEMDEPLARIVEMRFFAGLTEEEIAAALDVSTRTVQRGWRTARAWLLMHLQDPGAEEGQ